MRKRKYLARRGDAVRLPKNKFHLEPVSWPTFHKWDVPLRPHGVLIGVRLFLGERLEECEAGSAERKSYTLAIKSTWQAHYDLWEAERLREIAMRSGIAA